jgi:hypothetical protein
MVLSRAVRGEALRHSFGCGGFSRASTLNARMTFST